ncbi:MAG: hypothetical protein SGJ19_14150, partial [Planctomycetia bacterium]|nr:hypothetical protein [Planctomycetia bacterium]
MSGWVHRLIPRAGLLGSLAAIALVLIAFIPLLEIWHEPLVGLPSLAVILCTLVARKKFPFKLPGALAALLVGGGIHYVLLASGWIEPSSTPFDPSAGQIPTLGSHRVQPGSIQPERTSKSCMPPPTTS